CRRWRPGRRRRGPPALALRRHPAGPRPDADDPDLRLPDSDTGPLRPRDCARADLDSDFRDSAPVRLTHLGVSSTPRDLIEAGLSFGASRRQLLWKVE